MNLYSANQIGLCASESLAKNRSGEVIGITSKGIFLKLADESIIFLSTSHFGNPLTINLNPNQNVPIVNPGEPINLAQQAIHFEQSSIIVQTGAASIYSSMRLSKPFSVTPHPKQVSSFLVTLRSRMDHSVALLDEALALIDHSMAIRSSDMETRSALELLVHDAVSSPLECVHPIRFFAGRGRGLTPSGDDLLMGWIYTLVRWGGTQALKLDQLRQALFQAIENRTTSISLNLIKAAAGGEIDERLLRAFEMMIGLRPFEDRAIQDILEWGSSSGIEVCAGMGLGIFTLYRLAF